MITDISKLLEELMRAEASLIERQGIRHAPTIGSMYEGLTQDILLRTIPIDLDLRVVNGFIEDPKGNLSPQIDCMLVRGSGRRLPYTESHVWSVLDVLAIIEHADLSLYRAKNDGRNRTPRGLSELGQKLSRRTVEKTPSEPQCNGLSKNAGG